MLKILLLAGVLATNPAPMAPVVDVDPLPWATVTDLMQDVVGANEQVCGEYEPVTVVEIQRPEVHYSLWVLKYTTNMRFVVARYLPNQDLPDHVWYGTQEKGGKLNINQSMPYKDGMDPCAEWLTPSEG